MGRWSRAEPNSYIIALFFKNFGKNFADDLNDEDWPVRDTIFQLCLFI